MGGDLFNWGEGFSEWACLACLYISYHLLILYRNAWVNDKQRIR